MIKLIIFDYDGVIVDSFPNVHDVYKTLCKELGKYCPEELKDFKEFYGKSSTAYYTKAGFTEEERRKGNKIFREEIIKKDSKPFKGIIETIKILHKKYTLCVLSSSYKEEVEQKLKNFEIYHLFNFVIGREDENGRRFEKTESIRKLLTHLGVSAKEVLLIGDRNLDFIEGSKAGLQNILLVDYGWGYDPIEIPEYKSRFKVDEPKDILEAVKQFN